MINFTWSATANAGQLNKDTQWGTYLIAIVDKPTFSFDYTDITFVEGASHYFYDNGTLMNPAQIAEIKAWADSVEVDPLFKVAREGKEHFQFLKSTDYLFTVDKYATLSPERQQELTSLREQARAAIAELELAYGV